MDPVSLVAYQIVPRKGDRGSVLFVQEFHTFESHQGKGYGSKLLKDVMEKVILESDESIDEVHLVVDRENTGALRLYTEHYEMQELVGVDERRALQSGQPMRTTDKQSYYSGMVEDMIRNIKRRYTSLDDSHHYSNLSTKHFSSKTSFMFDDMMMYKRIFKTLRDRKVKELHKDVLYAVMYVSLSDVNVE